jgi:hypothetical protein
LPCVHEKGAHAALFSKDSDVVADLAFDPLIEHYDYFTVIAL